MTVLPVILLISGPCVHPPVEGRDPQRVPPLVADTRRNEPKNTQQVWRRHGRRHDHHGEPTDDAARPQQQRLLDALCCLRHRLTDRLLDVLCRVFIAGVTRSRNLYQKLASMHMTKIVGLQLIMPRSIGPMGYIGPLTRVR